jgi:hypothetical protein
MTKSQYEIQIPEAKTYNAKSDHLTNTAHYKPRHERNQSEVYIKSGFSQMSMPKSDYPKKQIRRLWPGKGISYCLQVFIRSGQCNTTPGKSKIQRLHFPHSLRTPLPQFRALVSPKIFNQTT